MCYQYKGISLSAVKKILGDCEKTGIKVILNFMFGFPGETEEEAKSSTDFIDEISTIYHALDITCNTKE